MYLLMLIMVGGCSQDNIIYKCTKLHDHSSNRKSDIASPLTFFLNDFFCTPGPIYIT